MSNTNMAGHLVRLFYMHRLCGIVLCAGQAKSAAFAGRHANKTGQIVTGTDRPTGGRLINKPPALISIARDGMVVMIFVSVLRLEHADAPG